MTSGVLPLIIYAYSAFTSSWGPGPTLSEEFKKETGITVQFVDVGDGGSLISRLKLEGDKTRADLVLGVDENLLGHLKWNTKPVLYDYSPYAFVYNSQDIHQPPQALDDLLKPQFKNKILLEDPRLSTPGLGFLLWVIREKGEPQAWEFLKQLKGQVRITAPSWDLAYGIFKKEPGTLVFSYWTSPAYHIQEEDRYDIKAAPFANGHYVQKEYVVINPKSSKKKAQDLFVKFLLSDFAQNQIAKKNFMFPVNKKTRLPKAFDKLGRVKELSPLKPSQEQLELWLKKWRDLFS